MNRVFTCDSDAAASANAAAGTSVSNDAVLDASQLLGRCLGNIELAERVLTRFVDTLPRELEQLEQLIDAGDGEQVRAVAHRVKGAAANIAATRLQSRLEDLETVASESRLDDATAIIEELDAELLRLSDQRPPWRLH